MWVMGIFNQIGNYFTTGAHSWYLFIGVPLLIICAAVFLPKDKKLQQQMYPQGIFTFGDYTFRVLSGGPFLIVCGAIGFMGVFSLYSFEQQSFDPSLAPLLFQRGSFLLGLVCTAIIIVGAILTYIGWRQYRNKRPEQKLMSGPFY